MPPSKSLCLAACVLLQQSCLHNKALFALANPTDAAEGNTLHMHAEKSIEVNAVKSRQLEADLAALKSRSNALRKEKQECLHKIKEAKKQIAKFQQLENDEDKGELGASSAAVAGDTEHDRLTTGLHAEIAAHENKVKVLQKKLKSVEDEMQSIQQKMSKEQTQKEAIKNRDKSDKEVLAATAECEGQTLCEWNEQIALTEALSEWFVMTESPDFVKLHVKFEPKYQRECKLNVMLGVDEQCAVHETKKTKKAMASAHKICNLHFNKNRTHLHLCRHCDNIVFDVVELRRLYGEAAGIKVKHKKHSKKVCLIVRNEGKEECSLQAEVALEASEKQKGMAKQIVCAGVKKKKSNSNVTQLQAEPKGPASAGDKVQIGYWGMLVTVVVFVVSVVMGVYVVIV